MLSRLARFVGGIAAAALGLVLLSGGGQPAGAEQQLRLPWAMQPVEQAGTLAWPQQPGSQQSGRIAAIVHLPMAPLAAVGREWSHEQRRAYIASLTAAQDALIPQIEALGGRVVGRFTHAAAGLAIEIDVSRTAALRQLGGVAAISGIANYQLDLRETAPWIGAAAARQLGLDGSGVDVAVIDSGIDYTHVKLGGAGTTAAYAQAYCGDPARAPDPADPACGAHSAAADPRLFPNTKVRGGYDWVGEFWPDPNPRCGKDASGNPATCVIPDANPIDFEGHGTHVADIIGGLESAAGAGDQGVAPGVNLWAFKACSAVASACNGLALLLAIDDALDLDNSDSGACTPGVDAGCRAYDPADVINLSLGALYGQPEDDLSLFADLASYYGSVVVASAGNNGDRPYIVGSPSTSAAAISVAQSTVPSDRLYTISAGAARAGGVLQPWSVAMTETLAGPLQYGDETGANRDGCQAFARPQTGKVLLVDRGVCAVSLKAANASAAGAAFVVVANNQFSNTPPSFSSGGGTVTIPALTITLDESEALKAALAESPGLMAEIGPEEFVALVDDIVASSSRGPRIADGAIKPDISAPGASVSAVAGSGSGTMAFGGTSGAAPMVAGAAALLVQHLEQQGVLDPEPGVEGPAGSAGSRAYLVKSLLMNTANPRTTIGGSFLAPITLQGAGRLDVLAAIESQTLAYDVTELKAYLLNDPATSGACRVTHKDLIEYIVFKRKLPPCAREIPFGNAFFRAWNAQTGSLSFGYETVSSSSVETRQIALLNLGDTERTYTLSAALRYADDEDTGVTMTVTPPTVTVAPRSSTEVTVTMSIGAARLRPLTLDAGRHGNAGTNIYCDNPDYFSGCPTLTMFEVDGYVMIDGGPGNSVRLPWQVLPKLSTSAYVAAVTDSWIGFRNPALYKTSDVDVFALVDESPNNCEIVDGSGNCVTRNYVPGMLPGIEESPIDLHQVGVRSFVAAGVNAYFGLPAAPDGNLPDEIIQFGITVYDAPFRASHNYPVRFEVHVDADRDGVYDYIVFNADANNSADGRNAVFVADINPADGTRPVRPYFYSVTSFNSQNWILPVPAAALGTLSNEPFDFFVLAVDNYFSGRQWDCSPFNNGVCGAAAHTFQTSTPRYRAVTTAFQLPIDGQGRLYYSTPSAGPDSSPSQIGLLFLYRDARAGLESESVILAPNPGSP